MAKDAGDRYASTRDLARELRTLRERLPETSPGNRLLASARRSRTQIVAAAGLVVLGSSAVIYRASHASAAASPQLPAVKVVGVLPFKDLTRRSDDQLFTEGFAEAVRARLKTYEGIQMPTTDSAPSLMRSNASLQRIAKELGATILIRASVQRSGDDVRVVYAVVDPTGSEIAGGTVDGRNDGILALQDDVARHVARDLGARQRADSITPDGLQTPEEQEIYTSALGALDHGDDAKAVDAAIASLHELLETAPNASLVHAALGRAYFLKYRHTFDAQWSEKAIRACNRARTLDPSSPDTLMTLATVQRHVGQYADAIQTYQRALALQPASALAAIGLGSTYEANHQYDDAERAFRRGIALNRSWWYGHNELGAMYMFTGKYDAALNEFREVIRLQPDGSWGYTNAGAILFMKARLDEAAAMFAKATELQPDDAAWLNLGSCHFLRGDYDAALACDRKAVDLVPGKSTYWVELADAASWTAQHHDEAVSAYRKAIETARAELQINAKNARAHAALAIAAARLGDFKTGRNSIERALELQPQNPERFYQAARVANLAGNEAEAISWLKRALASGSFFLEVQRHPEFARLRETQAVRELLARQQPG